METSEEILAKLISYPTISKDSNVQLINYVRDYLINYGIDSVLVSNVEKTKFNLYASIGPEKLGGILLSGHTDVVPVEGQDWTVDPFNLSRQGDRLYGRGTTDMKGFLACVLAMVPQAVIAKLNVPIHLVFSYDEEIGCIGIRRMLDVLEVDYARPKFCIVGEPTSMQIGIAHKGKVGMTCRCYGSSAHSALTNEGLNAIYLACDMIAEIRKLHNDLSSGKLQEEFRVPHSTLHVGTIQGGTALNIIPNYCEFKFEIRNLEADDSELLRKSLVNAAETIANQYRHEFEDANICIEVFNQYPALQLERDAEIINYVSDLLDKQEIIGIDFGTEAGIISSRLSVPAVVCGPGSMEQGHKANEYIQRSELERCDIFLSKLVHQLTQ
ncbi:MAG: acetylornithine deacetylase [Gammaproteobacteria bacterium]|nr:acetylornithine deacetylase [Gammaproteobacteria bacterium]MCY4218452.1 acetylornithine deacetylase [Gammaproteobacteria bacterium]MCY4274524.1 acetylornithine deacetylase [Gammaproteobacteria bacterium]